MLKPDEILRRIFEPLPADWQKQFHAGDTVVLIREQVLGIVPVGCEGVIEEIHHPMSAMAEKGRPFLVRFNLAGADAKLPDNVLQALRRAGFEPDEAPRSIVTDVGPNDVMVVHKPGDSATPTHTND